MSLVKRMAGTQDNLCIWLYRVHRWEGRTVSGKQIHGTSNDKINADTCAEKAEEGIPSLRESGE